MSLDSIAESRRAYSLQTCIGRGTYGRVYLARRKRDDKIGVVKEINLAGLTELDIGDIVNEIAIMQRLRHRHIVEYWETFRTRDAVYIAMEHCSRGDLAAHLRQHGPMSEREVWTTLVDTSTALAYAHEQGIIHRDIKPHNILLGRNDEAKLADFGLGRVLGPSGRQAQTFAIGTPLYMAPELCNETPYDGRCDVWSLGCVVFEMLAGRPPFSATNPVALARKITTDPAPGLGEKCSLEMQFLVYRMLDKNASTRPRASDVLQFALRAVEAFAAGEKCKDENFDCMYSSVGTNVRPRVHHVGVGTLYPSMSRGTSTPATIRADKASGSERATRRNQGTTCVIRTPAVATREVSTDTSELFHYRHTGTFTEIEIGTDPPVRRLCADKSTEATPAHLCTSEESGIQAVSQTRDTATQSDSQRNSKSTPTRVLQIQTGAYDSPPLFRDEATPVQQKQRLAKNVFDGDRARTESNEEGSNSSVTEFSSPKAENAPAIVKSKRTNSAATSSSISSGLEMRDKVLFGSTPNVPVGSELEDEEALRSSFWSLQVPTADRKAPLRHSWDGTTLLEMHVTKTPPIQSAGSVDMSGGFLRKPEPSEVENVSPEPYTPRRRARSAPKPSPLRWPLTPLQLAKLLDKASRGVDEYSRTETPIISLQPPIDTTREDILQAPLSEERPPRHPSSWVIPQRPGRNRTKKKLVFS